jgi:hypothetical protein
MAYVGSQQIEEIERQLIRRGNIAGGGGGPVAWVDVTGKPTTFPPSTHGHDIGDVTGLQAALDGKQPVGSYAPAIHGHAITDVTGLQTALDGKAAASAVPRFGEAIVSVPNNRFEWIETVAAVGVAPANRILVTLGNHVDADENDGEMLDVMGVSAMPGTDQITFCLAFGTPTAGPVKLNWSAHG